MKIDEIKEQCHEARKDAERLAEAIKHADRFKGVQYFGGGRQLDAALAAHETLKVGNHEHD